MSSHAVGFADTCRLQDGRLVSLRSLGAADAEAVVALHRCLNDHDRYYRFFTLSPVHLDQLVSKLIEPTDGRCALGAFDGERLIGIANYAVVDDPTVADVAIVVAHADHLHGVGTALLRRLAQIAKTRGIRRFVADILSENHTMFQVLSDLGWLGDRRPCGSVRHVEIELPDCPADASTSNDLP
nr:GNAT family N-acetyltransferase [Mycobacterium rhizamassiliense]